MTLSQMPYSAEAYSNHGNFLKENGKLEEAIDSYRLALTIKPDFAEAYGDLGLIFKEQGKLDKAIDCYRQALTIKPDYAKAYINLGVVLQEGGLLSEAAANYQRALAIKSDYVAAHFNLGALHMSLGQTEDALRSFRQAITFKPDLESAAHMIAVLEGKTPQSAPHDYIRSLFDQYSKNFENHLLHTLEYTAPDLLFHEFSALGLDQGPRLTHALDLGCGTGLNGRLFRDSVDCLSGVDLSQNMLQIARNKNVYDHLYAAELVTFLKESNELYDLFLATDVFVYVGELEMVFTLVRDRSLPGAYFAFSIESADGVEFILQKSARYAHSREYIRSLCSHFGFRVAACESINLRKDHGVWVGGDIFVLQLVTNWQ